MKLLLTVYNQFQINFRSPKSISCAKKLKYPINRGLFTNSSNRKRELILSSKNKMVNGEKLRLTIQEGSKLEETLTTACEALHSQSLADVSARMIGLLKQYKFMFDNLSWKNQKMVHLMMIANII